MSQILNKNIMIFKTLALIYLLKGADFESAISFTLLLNIKVILLFMDNKMKKLNLWINISVFYLLMLNTFPEILKIKLKH